MSYRDILKAHLIDEEGLSRVPYLDTHKPPIWTVAIGHNMQARPLPPDWKYPLTDAQIDQLYQEDTADADSHIRNIFHDVFETWTDNRKAAMVDLMYNMGAHKFLSFGPTIAHVRAGQWEDVARHLEGTNKPGGWYYQVKTRGPKIVKMIREG